MKRGNTDESPSDKFDTTNGIVKCLLQQQEEESNVVKKSNMSKNTEFIESVNNLVFQQNVPCTNPSSMKKLKRKTSNIGSRDKKLSDLLDMIAESRLEPAELTCGFDRLGQDFYDVSCEELARNLLGQTLVRRLENGIQLKGKIVETECYLGGVDKASHSHNGKITERNLPMFMKPGTTYVYFTYGMYHCFNISSQGTGAAVLLRALEPVEGSDHMLQHRIAGSKRKTSTDQPSSKPKKPLQEHELCNGPAKLCMSFRIEKLSCNRRNLSEWDGMWVERGAEGVEVREHQVVKTSRIGIESAGVEWATKPLRFYLAESKAVSKRDKIKEKELKMVAKLLAS